LVKKRGLRKKCLREGVSFHRLQNNKVGGADSGRNKKVRFYGCMRPRRRGDRRSGGSPREGILANLLSVHRGRAEKKGSKPLEMEGGVKGGVLKTSGGQKEE